MAHLKRGRATADSHEQKSLIKDDKVSRLFIVRHAEHVSESIESLSRKGSLQAHAIAKTLKQQGEYDAIYSSSRCKETAEIIGCVLNLPVIFDDRLQNWNGGVLTGLPIETIKKKYPDIYQKRYKQRIPDYRVPEGESLQERYERVENIMNEIAQKSIGKNAVLVTHGGVIDDMYRMACQFPLPKLTGLLKPYGCLSVLAKLPDGTWRDEQWAAVNHLPQVVAESPTGGHLYLFPHQVAGSNPMFRGDRGELCKPASQKELECYERIGKIYPQMEHFVPVYLGTVDIDVKHIIQDRLSLSRPLHQMPEPLTRQPLTPGLTPVSGSHESEGVETLEALSLPPTSDAIQSAPPTSTNQGSHEEGQLTGDSLDSVPTRPYRSLADESATQGDEPNGNQASSSSLELNSNSIVNETASSSIAHNNESSTCHTSPSNQSIQTLESSGNVTPPTANLFKQQGPSLEPKGSGGNITTSLFKLQSVGTDETESEGSLTITALSKTHISDPKLDSNGTCLTSEEQLVTSTVETPKLSSSSTDVTANSVLRSARSQQTRSLLSQESHVPDGKFPFSVTNLWTRFAEGRWKKVVQSKEGNGRYVYLVLENLSHGLLRPHILDLKVGTQQHGPEESDAKKFRKQQRCASTTSATMGIRLAGMQRYLSKEGKYLLKDKYWGRSLNQSSLECALCNFVMNGEKVRVSVVREIIFQLKGMLKAIKQTRWRFYGSSILIVFDGEALSQTVKIENGIGNDTTQVVEKPNSKMLRKHSICDAITRKRSRSRTFSEESSQDRVSVRLIDFSHCDFDELKYDTYDHGVVYGLENLLRIYKELLGTTQRGSSAQDSGEVNDLGDSK